MARAWMVALVLVGGLVSGCAVVDTAAWVGRKTVDSALWVGGKAAEATWNAARQPFKDDEIQDKPTARPTPSSTTVPASPSGVQATNAPPPVATTTAPQPVVQTQPIGLPPVYRAHMGDFVDIVTAEMTLNRARQQIPLLFKHADGTILRTVRDNRTIFQAQVGDFSDETAAALACSMIGNAGFPCQVVEGRI